MSSDRAIPPVRVPLPRPTRALVLAIALAGALAAGGEASAVTLRPGDIVFTDFGASVAALDPATGAVTPIAGGFVESLDVALGAGGDLFVVDIGFPAPGEIVRVDPATGARATFASGGAIQHPDAIIAAPGGGFFVADRGSQEIIRLDASGNQTVFATSASFVVPQGMAFDASGNLYVADQGAAALFRITPGGALSVVSSGQLFGHPIDVAIGASGDLFVADQSAGGGIYRVDAATGAQSRLTSGLTHAIAFAADGRLIATDGQTAVYFVDPATGATEPIAAIDAAAFEVVPGAVPEPAGLALAALGALALRRARRRG